MQHNQIGIGHKRERLAFMTLLPSQLLKLLDKLRDFLLLHMNLAGLGPDLFLLMIDLVCLPSNNLFLLANLLRFLLRFCSPLLLLDCLSHTQETTSSLFTLQDHPPIGLLTNSPTIPSLFNF